MVLCVLMVIGGALLTEAYLASVGVVSASGALYSLSGCTQYSANDTTNCTSVGNGTYVTTGWTRVDDPHSAVDNDSATYSTDLCEWSTQNFSMTYPLAANQTSAIWEVKYTLESTTHTNNYTLTSPTCSQTGSSYVLYVVSSTEANQSCDISFGCRNATGITWLNHAP